MSEVQLDGEEDDFASEEAVARLECFLQEVANTRLKVQILAVFLNQP